MTFWLVGQCLNQLSHHVPHKYNMPPKKTNSLFNVRDVINPIEMFNLTEMQGLIDEHTHTHTHSHTHIQTHTQTHTHTDTHTHRHTHTHHTHTHTHTLTHRQTHTHTPHTHTHSHTHTHTHTQVLTRLFIHTSIPTRFSRLRPSSGDTCVKCKATCCQCSCHVGRRVITRSQFSI